MIVNGPYDQKKIKLKYLKSDGFLFILCQITK